MNEITARCCKHAKVIAVDAKLLADLIFVALFQNYGAQDAAVPLGKLIHDLLDQLPAVAGHQLVERIGAGIGRFDSGVFVLHLAVSR